MREGQVLLRARDGDVHEAAFFLEAAPLASLRFGLDGGEVRKEPFLCADDPDPREFKALR